LIDPIEQTITQGWWRQGKIDGKTTVYSIKDMNKVNILSSKGIGQAPNSEVLFRLPLRLVEIDNQ
jgi:hypothetical protein